MEEKITAWIARDKNNNLYLFRSKPYKENYSCENSYWDTDYHNDCLIIPNSSFPQVKWEDEEPTKVELTIKICK